MTTAIEKAATKLREKLTAETTAALERKHKLMTKHSAQLQDLERKDKSRLDAILSPYSAEVQKAALGPATDPPGIERVKGMARSDGKAVPNA
jgi:hypothetical protein